jgi:uncharacterized membrane protein YphA (DoxX/SURF4 family)
MQLKNASHLFFALTLIGIGLVCLVSGTFAPIWAGVPKTFPDRQLLAILATIVSLVCGACLVTRRWAAPAALVLLLFLAVWTVLFKVPVIVRHPLVEVAYQSAGENAVLIAAAWVLYVWFANGRNFPAGDTGLRIAHLLYGLALIAFGLSHFAYLNLTAPLIPRWLPPGPIFWAYFTGAAYLAAGLAILIGIAGRLGAVGSAFQITLITLIVWGPGVATGKFNASNLQEPVVSWALTAAAWVVAASFERYPWLKPLGFGGGAGRRLARG